MTQEEKSLLLKDLSARLPYNVIVDYSYNAFDVHNGNYVKHGSKCILRCYLLDVFMSPRQNEKGEYIKPYLRPMSSMTEEEKAELQKITNDKFHASFNYISNSNSHRDSGEWHVSYNNFVTNAVCNKLISWLDEKYFDHRTDEEGKTLIEIGLAIEAPEGMYKTK